MQTMQTTVRPHLLSPVSYSSSPPSPSSPSPPQSTSSPCQSCRPSPLSLPRVISFAKTGSRFNIADLSRTFFCCLKQQQEIVMLRAVARCLGRSHKREISPQVARSVGRGLWHGWTCPPSSESTSGLRSVPQVDPLWENCGLHNILPFMFNR